MKKIILFGSLVFAIGFTIYSCKKDKFPINNKEDLKVKSSSVYPDVSTDGSLLIFKNSTVFEKYSSLNQNEDNIEFLLGFEKWASKLEFPHLDGRLAIQQLATNDSDVTDDETIPLFITSVLNSDGAFQIGEYIYRLDFLNSQVYVIPSNQRSNLYSKIVSGNVSDKNILKYSFEEEVVEMVESGKISELIIQKSNQEKKHKKDTPEGWGFEMVSNWQLLDTNLVNSWGATFKASKYKGTLKARYWKFGVHFSLKTKLTNSVKEATINASSGQVTLSTSWKTSTQDYRIKWQRRYQINNGGSHAWMCNLQSEGKGNVVGQSYRGMKRLSKFQLVASAYIKLNGTYHLMSFNPEEKPGCTSTLYQVGIKHGY